LNLSAHLLWYETLQAPLQLVEVRAPRLERARASLTCGRRAICNSRTDEMRRRQVTAGGFSSKRLARLRELLERHVHSGFVPGVVAVLARRGEVHVEAT